MRKTSDIAALKFLTELLTANPDYTSSLDALFTQYDKWLDSHPDLKSPICHVELNKLLVAIDAAVPGAESDNPEIRSESPPVSFSSEAIAQLLQRQSFHHAFEYIDAVREEMTAGRLVAGPREGKSILAETYLRLNELNLKNTIALIRPHPRTGPRALLEEMLDVMKVSYTDERSLAIAQLRELVEFNLIDFELILLDNPEYLTDAAWEELASMIDRCHVGIVLFTRNPSIDFGNCLRQYLFTPPGVGPHQLTYPLQKSFCDHLIGAAQARKKKESLEIFGETLKSLPKNMTMVGQTLPQVSQNWKQSLQNLGQQSLQNLGQQSQNPENQD